MPDHAEKALALQERASQKYAAINADPRRSDQAKRDDKIRAWSELRRDLDALKTEQNVARETQKRTLERKLFGLPPGATANDVMTYRDAEANAAQLNDMQEAAVRMNSARARGDDQLVRAIAARAVDAGWDPLVDAYVTDIRPEAAADLADLHRASSPSFQSEFMNEGNFHAFPPPGLSGTSQYALESEARKLDAEDGLPTVDTGGNQPGQSALTALLGQVLRDADRSGDSFDDAPAFADDTYFEAS